MRTASRSGCGSQKGFRGPFWNDRNILQLDWMMKVFRQCYFSYFWCDTRACAGFLAQVCVWRPEVNVLFHHCSATWWCKPAPPHPALTLVLGIEPWSSCFYSKHYPLSHLPTCLSFLTSRKLRDQY